jgi:HSP20 family protein
MVLRFDPFRDIDRLMDQVSTAAARAPRSFPMDAFRRGDEFIIKLDLPGLDPADIDINVERNALTVTAERRPSAREGDDLVVLERPQGTFTRQLLIGDTLDKERLRAAYDQGVLTITIPVAEHTKPRRVEITTSGRAEPQTIEGTASDRAEADHSDAGQHEQEA